MRPPALLLAAVLLASGCGEGTADRLGDGGPDTATVTVGPSADAAPLDACPATFPAPQDRKADDPWVPAPPTTETAGRLVPDADPVTAVVCRYDSGGLDGPGDRPAALTGEVAVTTGLDRVRTELLLPERLEGQTRACTLMGTPLVPHLLRLDYADGSLWLSAVQDGNACQSSGNGDFVTPAYLGQRLAEAYDQRAWPAPPPPGPCGSGPSGRAGEERVLVPDGWTSVLVCEGRVDAPPGPARVLGREAAERLVEALREVAVVPGSGGCSGAYDRSWSVHVAWPAGPGVAVRLLPGCDPPVSNGSLDGRATAAQVERLEALLRGP